MKRTGKFGHKKKTKYTKASKKGDKSKIYVHILFFLTLTPQASYKASHTLGWAALPAATSTAPRESEKQKSGARRGCVRYVPRH